MPGHDMFDLAYLAGIIDGEGYIGIGNAPRLRVANTNPRLMEWLRCRFGGSIWTSRKRDGRSKALFTWELSARKAERVLREVAPFLILKREQAAIILAHYATGIRYQPMALAEAKSQLAALNRKGVRDAVA
jgi:hypothetical protein